jgi:uncharacterized repeat protein (TIGR01451 family)
MTHADTKFVCLDQRQNRTEQGRRDRCANLGRLKYPLFYRLFSCRTVACRVWLPAFSIVLLLLCLTNQAQAVPPGTVISNTAQASFSAWGASSSAASNTVSLTTTWLRTPSHIELLQYAPTVGTAEHVSLPDASYSPDGTVGGATQSVAAIHPAGSTTPIDLSQPVALAPVTIYHQGEPVFFRVTDPDQDIDPLTAETVWILASTDQGDSELLQLTETAPDSGIFMGYLQSSGLGSAQAYDGVLQVIAGTHISARYTDAADATDSTSMTVLVDPNGLVFDSATGQPVNNVGVTLIDGTTGQPAVVYGDDGISSFPAAVTSGGTFTDSSGKVYTFPSGTYRFPFVAPGNYRLVVQPPAGYAAPSTVPTTVLQALPGGPFAIAEPGSRGEPFALNPGPALRIDIPVDPINAGLWVRKTANQDTAAIGDFIQYTLTIENSVGVPAAGVSAIDRLPPGFRYRKGSARLNAKVTADPTISADGRTLTFAAGDLPAGGSTEIRYVTEIGAGTRPGKASNSARAASTNGLRSNTATAEVTVKEDLFRSKGFIVGRVIADNCGDAPTQAADGVPGVRLYLEDGTYVVTDELGRYHFEGVSPGTHVVQLDPESLPPHLQVSDCGQNTRSAGTPFSRFVDLQGGTLWRTDFHVASKPPPSGRAELKMTCGLVEKTAHFETHIAVHEVDLSNVRLSVVLPDGTRYVPGTSHLSGRPLDDPQSMGQVLIYRLGDVTAGQSQVIRFQLALNGAAQPGRLHTRALLTFNTPSKKNQRTEAIDTVLVLSEQRSREMLDPIVVRPQFESFSDVLLPAGRKVLDETADRLDQLEIEHAVVAGHTDNLPIREDKRPIFRDNQALSLARARRVAQYLAARWHLTPGQLTVIGKGDAEPLTSNATEAGRAINRRVEVTVMAVKVSVVHDIATLKCEDQSVARTQGLRGTPQPATAEKNSPAQKPADQDFNGIDIETLAQGFAWLMPRSDFNPSIPSVKIVVQHAPTEQVELQLNGTPVSALNFDGLKINRARTVAVSYWRGVNLNEGDNVFTAIRKDKAGMEIGRLQHTVYYAGIPVHAVLDKAACRLVANGKDAPIVAVRLTDNTGRPARPGLQGNFSIEAPFEPLAAVDELHKGLPAVGNLKPTYTIDPDGVARIRLQPTTHTGQAAITLHLNSRDEVIRAWLQPEARDWILVGLAEGTAGYNAVSGNMEQLDAGDTEPDFYKNGRLAFFAKGKIKGQWLLTAAYDSARDRHAADTRLFQTIDPDTYYTLYGDGTQQQYDAASVRKLYLKIERERFYALFGDFDTGLTVTELSRYSRRFNGFKSEYNGERFGYSAFAADTDQAYARDEIQGNGTSGLYHLSRGNIVANSETVTIQVRDRFRSDIILSSQTLVRFVDYSIDYDAGTLFFKSPIYSRDENFNPIFIVAEYESEDSADQSYTYGGRGSVKFWNQRLEVGATMVHESPKNAQATLGGLDAAIDLGGGLKARAEIAATRKKDADAGDTVSGQAYLAEVSRTTPNFDSRVYYRELGEDFGLGQQNGSEDATRKIGLDATWRFKPAYTLAGQAYHYDYLATGAQRDLGEANLLYHDALYSLNAGVRVAEDRFEDGTDKRSTQLLAGASRLFFHNRLQLRASREQCIGGNNSVDFPTRTILGADFKVAEPMTLFAEHEITQGEDQNTQSTRVGFKSTPWRGGQLGSSLGRQMDENGARLFAELGLLQSWQINKHWSVDAGLDRSQTIQSDHAAPFDPNVPTAAGTSEDFTAVTLGLGYRAKSWSWTGRLESRRAESQDQWNLVSGIAGEVRPGLGLSLGAKIFDTQAADGTDHLNGDVRLSLARRPKNAEWIVLDRLDIKFQDQSDAEGSSRNRSIVNNFNANYKPQDRLQLALQYGAKYVFDTIDGDDYTGYTDLTGIEARYDLAARWDIGVQADLLHSWQTGQFDHRLGLSVGYTVVKNTWLSLGYNLTGFKDEDFSEADYTAQGPYIKFRVKFDQQTARQLVDWFSRKSAI